MGKNSGAKLSTSEYATRKLIDVVAAVAVPLASAAAGYVVMFHGQDISNAIKKKIHQIKNSRQK